MSEVYPARREELDLYLQHILDISNSFPGSTFYDYHRQFSSKAASALQYGTKVDWSMLDTTLFCKVTAGHKVHACDLCNSIIHSTAFCPLNLDKPGYTRPMAPSFRNSRGAMTGGSGNRATDIIGRSRLFHAGQEICNNFNAVGGCTKGRCWFHHICRLCKGSHSAVNCSSSTVSQAASAPPMQDPPRHVRLPLPPTKPQATK